MEEINEKCVRLVRDIAKLMRLAGENPFKVRAFERAEEVIYEEDELEKRAQEGTLTELPGIGKGISEVLSEFLLKGTTSVKDEIEASLPEGLVDLVRIPGVGPKKAMSLIEQLNVRSVQELEYACHENRLLNLKGFGSKGQESILEGIRFLNSTRGQVRLVDAEAPSQECLNLLRKAAGSLRVEETGALRRRCEILDQLEYLVELPSQDQNKFQTRIEKAVSRFKEKRKGKLKVEVFFSDSKNFGTQLFQTTGSQKHILKVGVQDRPFSEEKDLYRSVKLPWIPPEMRETGEEVRFAQKEKLGSVVEKVKGIFHNHTNRSDGSATLEQMVIQAKKLGYEYIGISDHSQSSVYAQGLKKKDLQEQEKEVRNLQEKHPEIRIFWGIESDILKNGDLDYDAKTLSKFDFVIASIHQRYKADQKTMTERMIRAIRNPATRFIGHITGRLLLGREPYPLDLEEIFRVAEAENVAIELNANPARLDIDWRWGSALRKAKTRISIHPDAHSLRGLEDTRFGILMARKALIPASQVLNTRDATEVEKWLQRK